MEIFFIIVAFAIGVAIGYVIFYFRYTDVKLVDDLRNNVSELQHQLQTATIGLKEFEQQNLLLKERATSLTSENIDLRKATSELYRYYQRIKDGHAKALELVDLLKAFDKDFDEKLRIGGDERSIPIQMPSLESGIKRF